MEHDPSLLLLVPPFLATTVNMSTAKNMLHVLFYQSVGPYCYHTIATISVFCDASV